MDSNNPKLVQLHRLRFHEYIAASIIAERVKEMGKDLRLHLSGEPLVYLVMLKGAFVFAADLIRACGLPGEVEYVRAQT